MALLELKAITKEFPGVKALDGVSFSLDKGEVHALCGENGAGKSTLIKTLCGFYPYGSYGGQIVLDGQEARFQTLRAGEEAGIALIPQELALVPEMSIAENMMLGREPLQAGMIRWKEVHREASRCLGLVGMVIDPRRKVKELGIGQQQMVEIAKALGKKAEILVLDEPTAALTESDAQRLLRFLLELKARGVGIIYISHRLEEVFQISDRITVLRDGKSVATHPRKDITVDRVISLMVGREVKSLYPRPPVPSQEKRPLLAVKDWSVEDPLNPGRRVLRGVSFEVRAGEVLGVGGLMGAGRTALVSSVFGASRSRVEGTLIVDGKERPPFADPKEAIAAKLALVSEDRKRYGLVLGATIGENMTLATLKNFLRGLLLDHRARARESKEKFDALRIKAPGLHTLVRTLSGGNQQKVVIGKWLLTQPKVLFLDEPTRGIDVGAKAEIYQLINQLAAQGLGVVMVSSDLPELLGMSHRVLVLSLGKQTAVIPAGEATPERVMAAATMKV